MSEIIQRTPEWYATRLGKVTASRIADIVAKTKTGYQTTRANYLAELLIERLTGKSPEKYVNAAMQWGTDNESDARIAYEFATGHSVTEIGFVDHPTIAACGASPDGLVGSDGLVELKCPLTATHLETLLGRSVPGRHRTQIYWQLACSGRQWCDYVSFDPRLPERYSLFISRVVRDDVVILTLEKEVRLFLAELDDTLLRLERLDQFEAA